MAPRHRSSIVAPAGVGAPPARRSVHAVQRLQGAIGNRATGQVLARKPATKDYGSIKIGKLGPIKITGGNSRDWAAKKDPNTLEITSDKGKHSKELERLATAGTKIPMMKLTTPMVDQSGEALDYGSVEIEIGKARITGYTVDGKVESWSVVDFETVHRTTISHKMGA